MDGDVPISPHEDGTAQASRGGSTRRRSSCGTPVKILTDLPDTLPVMPQEVALIVAWWPALADLLSSNDNGDA